MSAVLRSTVVALVAAVAASAQQRELEAVLAEQRARLAAVTERRERLIDARIRHALGVAIDDPALRVEADERDLTAFGGAERLRALREEIAALTERRDRLEVMAARDREPAGAGAPPLRRASEEPDLQELLARAQRRLASGGPGDTATAADPAADAADRADAAMASADADDFDAESRPVGDAIALAAPEDPVELGRALCDAAARRLLLAERLAGDAASAAMHVEDAEHLLQKARTVLEPAVTATDGSAALVPYRHVFALARACELLGDHAAANLYYDMIDVRDRQGEPRTEPGPWGSAARIARAMMNWERRARLWRPAVDVDALDWSRQARSARRPR